MLVGEQPGDAEDKAGSPFVRPAGRMLDRAMTELAIDRSDVYLTKAVKHFKWLPKGSRRLHKNPSAREVAACRPWLEAEIAAIGPSVIVVLGATAGRALLGPSFRVTQQRGQVLPGPNGSVLVPTIHPSAIVRIRDTCEREEAFRQFVEGLQSA
jgi:DNA polymerase